MSDFFHLNASNENKVINRSQRIFKDSTQFQFSNNTFTVKTESKAYKQRIKFFLDAVKINENYYRIGKYYELEDGEQVQLNLQHLEETDFFSFYYNCSENNGNGDFTFKLIPNETSDIHIYYISQIELQDSFCNNNQGILNPSNPNNILPILANETSGHYLTSSWFPEFDSLAFNNVTVTTARFIRFNDLVFIELYCFFTLTNTQPSTGNSILINNLPYSSSYFCTIPIGYSSLGSHIINVDNRTGLQFITNTNKGTNLQLASSNTDYIKWTDFDFSTRPTVDLIISGQYITTDKF